MSNLATTSNVTEAGTMSDDSSEFAAIIRRLQALEQHHLDATPQVTPDVNDARALAVQRLINLRPLLDRLLKHEASSNAEPFDTQALIASLKSLYPHQRPEDDDDARLMFETARAVMIHLVEVKLAREGPVSGGDQGRDSGQTPTAKMTQRHYEWNLVVANILQALELHLEITNEVDEMGQAFINQPYRKMIGDIWLEALANLLRPLANHVHPLVQSAGMDTMCELISKHRPNKNALLELLSAQGLSEMIRESRDGFWAVSVFELAYRLLPVGKKERFAYIETLTSSGKEFGGPDGGMQTDLLNFNGGDYYELRDKWLPIIAAGSCERAQPFEISTLALDEQVLVTPDRSRFFWIAQDFLETEFEPALDLTEPSPASAPKDRKLYVSLQDIDSIDVDVTSEPGMLVLTFGLSRGPEFDMPPTEFATDQDGPLGSRVLVIRLKRRQEVVDRLRGTFADRGGRYSTFSAGLLPDSNDMPKVIRSSGGAVRVSRTAPIEAPMGKSGAIEADDSVESLGVDSKTEESDPIESFDSRKMQSQARAEQVREMAELPQNEPETSKNDSSIVIPLQQDHADHADHADHEPPEIALVKEQALSEADVGGAAEDPAHIEQETDAASTEGSDDRIDTSIKAPTPVSRESGPGAVQPESVARVKVDSGTKETPQGTIRTTRSSDRRLIGKDQNKTASTPARRTRAAVKRPRSRSSSPSTVTLSDDESGEYNDEGREDGSIAQQGKTAKKSPPRVEHEKGQPMKKTRVETESPVGPVGSKGVTDVSEEEQETLSPPRPTKSTSKKQYGQPKNKLKMMEKAERPPKRTRGSSIAQQGAEQAKPVIEVPVEEVESTSSLSDLSEDSDDAIAQTVTLPLKAGARAGSRPAVASKGAPKRVRVKSPSQDQSKQKSKDEKRVETGRTKKMKQVKNDSEESTESTHDDDITDYEEAPPKKRQPIKAQQLRAMQLPSPGKAGQKKKKKTVAAVVPSKRKASSVVVASTTEKRASPRLSRKTQDVPEKEVAATSEAPKDNIGEPGVVDQSDDKDMGGMEHDFIADQDETPLPHAPATEPIAVAPAREAAADPQAVRVARARSTESTMLDPAVDPRFVVNVLAEDTSAAEGTFPKILDTSETRAKEPIAQHPLDGAQSTKSEEKDIAPADLQRVLHEDSDQVEDESSSRSVGSPSPSPLRLGNHELGQTPQQTQLDDLFYDAEEQLAMGQDNDGGMHTDAIDMTDNDRVKAKMAIPDAPMESDQEDGTESLDQAEEFALSGEPNDEEIQHRVPSPLAVAAALPQVRFGPSRVGRTSFAQRTTAAKSERDRHRELAKKWKPPSHDPFFSNTGASNRMKIFDHRKRAKKAVARSNKPTISKGKSKAGLRAAARNVRASSAPPESSSPLPEISKDGRSKKNRREASTAARMNFKPTFADQERSSVIRGQLHGVVEIILETHENRCEFQLERLTAAQNAIRVHGWECSLPILQNTHRIAHAAEGVHESTLVRRKAMREKLRELEKTGAQVVADLV